MARFLVFLLLAFLSAENGLFAQSPYYLKKAEKILKADSISFEIKEQGCFHGKYLIVYLVKNGDETFDVVYSHNGQDLDSTILGQGQFLRFGEKYKETLESENVCSKSTTWFEFTLKSKKKSVMYRSYCKQEEDIYKKMLRIGI